MRANNLFLLSLMLFFVCVGNLFAVDVRVTYTVKNALSRSQDAGVYEVRASQRGVQDEFIPILIDHISTRHTLNPFKIGFSLKNSYEPNVFYVMYLTALAPASRHFFDVTKIHSIDGSEDCPDSKIRVYYSFRSCFLECNTLQELHKDLCPEPELFNTKKLFKEGR